jgi:hypothetical protein
VVADLVCAAMHGFLDLGFHRTASHRPCSPRFNLGAVGGFSCDLLSYAAADGAVAADRLAPAISAAGFPRGSGLAHGIFAHSAAATATSPRAAGS